MKPYVVLDLPVSATRIEEELNNLAGAGYEMAGIIQPTAATECSLGSSARIIMKLRPQDVVVPDESSSSAWGRAGLDYPVDWPQDVVVSDASSPSAEAPGGSTQNQQVSSDWVSSGPRRRPILRTEHHE